VTLPFGRWVSIDGLPGEPIIAFVYLDPDAGPSAKGGHPSDPNLATRPTLTVRLGIGGMTMHELSDDDVRTRKLPARPEWLVHYGPQPDAAAPWRAPWLSDPLLAGKFHPEFPNDTQALVHDGDPRRTRRAPELCWVRFEAAAPAPTRPVLVMNDRDNEIEPSPHVYAGELLNQPHALESVKRGDRIRLLSVHGMPHPLHVTEDYLREREGWAISACHGCGATEVFDPPSVLARVKFPDAPVGAVESFTSFCALCDGMQMLKRLS
jgi:hypothetical protein